MFDSGRLQCPVAIAMAAIGAVPPVTRGDTTSAWGQALQDFETTLSSSTAAASPTAHYSNRQQQQRETKLRLDDFLSVAAELERLTEAISIPKCPSAEEVSLTLAVDQWDNSISTHISRSLLDDCRRAAQQFSERNYAAALEVLLPLEPSVVASTSKEALLPFLNNIAACHYKMERWKSCITVCRRLIELCAAFDVAHRRLARAYVATDSIQEAKDTVRPRKTEKRWEREVKAVSSYEAYAALYDAQQFAPAQKALEEALGVFPCGTLESLKVQLLALDSKAFAVQYAQQRVKEHPYSEELRYWECALSFQEALTVAELQQVLQRVAQAGSTASLRQLTAHINRCMEAVSHAESLVGSQQWNAVIQYVAAELRSPYIGEGIKAALLQARSTALLRVERVYDSLDDAQRAMDYTEKSTLRAELSFLMSQCEEKLGRWRDAMQHARDSCRYQPSPERTRYAEQLEERYHRHRAKSAQQQQQQSTSSGGSGGGEKTPKTGGQQGAGWNNNNANRPPPPPQAPSPAPTSAFAILCIQPGADVGAVKKAYRALAMKWHPDKWCGRSEADVRNAEATFKRIQNAYEEVMASLRS